jgi:predicted permease
MSNPLPVFVQVILPLALVWGVGFLARRLLHLDPKPFSRAGLYLFTAPLIFVRLMESTITGEEAGRISLVVLLLVVVLWLLSAGLGRLLGLSSQDRSAFQLVSIFINAVNYGFPATLLALGQDGLERAVVFAVGHALLNNTVGVYIAARGKAGGVGQTLRQVLRIPMIYAVLLALFFRLIGFDFTGTVSLGGTEIPLLPSVYRAFEILAEGAIPVFLLVLGLQLGGRDQGLGAARITWPMLVAGVSRLIISPAVAWGLALLVGLEGLAARVVILEAAMPSAVLGVILATEFEARPRFVTKVVVGTTLLSMVTLTLLLSTWG